MDTSQSFQPAQTAAIVAQVSSSLRDLPQWMEAAFPAAQAGVSLGELRGMENRHFEALYAVATDLCDAERFTDATPIALQLTAHQPQDARFAFMAASCMQRLGQFREAAALYGLALLAEHSSAATYRLAECLAAMGETEKAIEAFDAAFDMSRRDERYRMLQERAADAISLLKRHVAPH